MGHNFPSFQDSYSFELIKNLPADSEDTGDVPMQETQGRYPGVGNGNSLQYSCLEHFMERSLHSMGLLRVGHDLATELCCAVISQAQLCPTLGDPMDSSLRGSSVHWDSPGKNTGVGSHFLLQGIFLTQE